MTFYQPNSRAEKAARVAAQTEKRHDSRKECFKLDSYTCRCCGKRFRGHAHHIIHGNRKPIHDLWNLITLCPDCHAAVHGEAIIDFMGRELSGWMLMLAVLEKWRGREGYRWSEVYAHAQLNAEKQINRMEKIK